ncbi:hypothetical protein INT45_006624 [Circinella minor]|uniref:Myb-like domain-containing protein n=1 Tax=Circinella minor TaxID=1195481 RepID=A0A8H7SDA5_9FUNG|nr:hypothetical protein INT45_006624 [Circinella minor]
MVRTKKSAVNSNSQVFQSPSSKQENDILSVDHSLPWNSFYNNGFQIFGEGLETTLLQEGERVPDANGGQHLLEYVHRERNRKTQKIRGIFNQLTQEEVDVMLMDCGCNEDEVIKRLQTRSDYLEGIQRIVSTILQPSLTTIRPSETTHSNPTSVSIVPIPAAKTPKKPKAQPKLKPKPQHQEQRSSTEQSGSSEQLVKTESPVVAAAAKISVNEQTKVMSSESKLATRSSPTQDTVTFYKRDSKKRSRMIGRLALDDALKQVTENPNKAFEGWSQARIRAFKMIERNPNSYYYRFNAPGEEQSKGPWTEEEKQLFFKRLQDVGANGQWGLFSTAIPGRVGYQCSNFYRLLIESGQLQDPNYVVDEKGKAHYLFDKRGSDGLVEKTFRTHSPHTFEGNNYTKKNILLPTTLTKNKKKTSNCIQDDDGDKSGTFKMNLRLSNLRSSARIAAKNHTRNNTVP